MVPFWEIRHYKSDRAPALGEPHNDEHGIRRTAQRVHLSPIAVLLRALKLHSSEAVKRSEFAGYAGYGYCAGHSRCFWDFRLYLLRTSDGMPIASSLRPRTLPKLTGVDLHGYTVIADESSAGQEFEQLMARSARPRPAGHDRCRCSARSPTISTHGSRSPAGRRTATSSSPAMTEGEVVRDLVEL